MCWAAPLAVIFCVVTGVMGQDIRLPPNIHETAKETQIYYRMGGSIELPCSADGVPKPSFEWFKDKNLLDPNQSNIKHAAGDNASIAITRMNSEDGGSYQCKANNLYGTSLSRVFFLQEAVITVGGTIDVMQYTVKEGDPLKVACITKKAVPPPSYSWVLANAIDDRYPLPLILNKRVNIDNDGNLYFSYTKYEDEQSGKIYKCSVREAINDETKGGSYSQITVMPGDTSNKKPVVVEKSMSPYVAILGESFTLRCIFSGQPEVAVSWSPVVLGRSVEQWDTALVVKETKLVDQETYTCTGRNQAGSTEHTIDVVVETRPMFDPFKTPRNMNGTVGKTVSFYCDADSNTKPKADVQWLINGSPVDVSNPGARMEVTEDGKRLSIHELCKDCGVGETDLRVIQCNVSNTHGYVFADAYLNVLLATKVIVTPPEIILDLEMEEAVFKCVVETDPSTAAILTWSHNGKNLNLYSDDPRVSVSDGVLTINVTGLGTTERATYSGAYKCLGTNIFSNDEEHGQLEVEGEPSTGEVTSAGFPLWWIFIIIALVLLILILVLICKLCGERNRGDSYPVDTKEKEIGNDPEKELAESGFRDFKRTEEQPLKKKASRSLPSLSGSQLDLDEEGSLNEYGDLDVGRFTEDGSFVGVYMK